VSRRTKKTTTKGSAKVRAFSRGKAATSSELVDWREDRKRYFSEAELAEIDRGAAEDLLEYSLELLRKHRKVTQQQLAKAAKTTQGEVSRIENAQDAYLSTLRRYVEGLGGHLEVLALFDDDERVKLKLF
jgi:hypothetical protein